MNTNSTNSVPLQDGADAVEVKLWNQRFVFLENGISDIKLSIAEIRGRLENKYVSKETFELRMKNIEKIVYGVIGVVLVAFITGLTTVVFK